MKTSPFLRTLLLSAVATVALATQAAAVIVYIDFGGSSSGAGWNNVPGNSVAVPLVDSTGAAISGTVATLGFGVGTSGMTTISGSAAALFPTATVNEYSDFFFASSTSTATFTGLDLAKTYQFTIYASRNGAGDRTSRYTLTGATTSVGDLNAAFNTSSVWASSVLSPAANGTIQLSVAVGPTNTTGFNYLGMVRIDVVPEPATGMILVSGAAALLFRRRRLA